MTTLPSARVSAPAVPWAYSGAVAGLLAAYGLLLFLLVEGLRGMIGLPLAERVGLLALSALTMYAAYRQMKALEVRSSASAAFQEATPWVVAGLVLIPFAALFVYRGMGGARAVAAGAVRVREAWPLAETPALLQPLAVAGNYLSDTWFATLLAVLIGGAALSFWPVFLKARLRSNGWRAHFLATVLAFPHMFCSCCASPIAGALYRSGAALSPTLAFAVAAPSLNLVTLLLAVLLLPSELAAVRVLGGLLISLPVSYAAAALSLRWAESRWGRWPLPSGGNGVLWWRGYGLLTWAISEACALGMPSEDRGPASPADAVARWLQLSGGIARVVLPLLLLGYLVAGTLQVLLPALGSSGHGVGAVGMAALLGTLLMIPTAVEIPVALALSQAGYPALAAVALVTLAPVSLPALLVVGTSVGSYRPVLALGSLVFLTGLAVGLPFLWLA